MCPAGESECPIRGGDGAVITDTDRIRIMMNTRIHTDGGDLPIIAIDPIKARKRGLDKTL
jgi:hypothetical protein